jgi:hypothetical protein
LSLASVDSGSLLSAERHTLSVGDLTASSIKPVIRHIPEYHPDDPLNHRLSALVRLEQFLDERTINADIIADLKTVAGYAKAQGERRIYHMAELILQQSRKYRTGNGPISRA